MANGLARIGGSLAESQTSLALAISLAKASGEVSRARAILHKAWDIRIQRKQARFF